MTGESRIRRRKVCPQKNPHLGPKWSLGGGFVHFSTLYLNYFSVCGKKTNAWSIPLRHHGFILCSTYIKCIISGRSKTLSVCKVKTELNPLQIKVTGLGGYFYFLY